MNDNKETCCNCSVELDATQETFCSDECEQDFWTMESQAHFDAITDSLD